MNTETLAKTIDHTQLKATAVKEDIVKLCAEAREYGFYSVCINPCWVPLAVRELEGSGVAVCTVIGFPLGANATGIKAAEASHAVLQGAREVDMVINIGALKNGDLSAVEADIRAVVEAVREAQERTGITAIVKVIIETCYLTDAEKEAACLAAKQAGADFVKTSTGFGAPGNDASGNPLPAGATVSDVSLMKKTVGASMRVKASGGIRDLDTALAMLNAGADRLGFSAGISIVQGRNEKVEMRKGRKDFRDVGIGVRDIEN
ncbi:MAG: deoxyribose-phosphate aldolase [Spirochaetaceae bacterium]|jgi:deoxyribose-phosphate aldolase|nr:deoxyribose-phosphate aldolase [Spirochaetaceae bacterium]